MLDGAHPTANVEQALPLQALIREEGDERLSQTCGALLAVCFQLLFGHLFVKDNFDAIALATGHNALPVLLVVEGK